MIGCWPKSIFSSLNGGAEYIQWGGTVMSPLDVQSPPMGNGHFPSQPLGGAKVSQLRTLDAEYQVNDPAGRVMEDWPKCYRSSLFSFRDGWSFHYGGPGGCRG